MNFKKAFGFLLIVAVVFMAAANMSLLAADNAAAPGTDCPKKAAVTVETVNVEVFNEYVFFIGQGRAEVVAVMSPAAGVLSEVKVSEGSLVDMDQELVVMNAAGNEEIKKLEAAAAKAKKILTARQNWKEKSEAAIQNATKAYQDALDLLNKRKGQTSQTIKAPLAGIVSRVLAAGSETTAGTVLLEISNPKQMIFEVAPVDSAKSSVGVGDKFIAMADGANTEVKADVIAISDTRITFKVNNDGNQVKEGVNYTFRKFITEHVDAMTISSMAIQKDSLGDFVYVVEKKKAKKAYVTLAASANGKTMVVKGLSTDALLIVSGFECLVDGKPVRVVNPQEMAKVKERPAVVEEKKVIEPEVKTSVAEQAENIAKATKHPITVGLLFERFTINDKNMREYYSNWFQHIPGLEVSYQVIEKIDVWASAKYYSDKQTTVFYEDTVRFTLIPFSLGARFRPAKLGAFEPFIGAGFNVYYYAETIKGESELENTSGLAIGFHFQGGTYFYFGSSFLKSIFAKHNRQLLGEIFLKYNIVNKTLAEMLPDGTDKLDLGGLEMGIGLAVKF